MTLPEPANLALSLAAGGAIFWLVRDRGRHYSAARLLLALGLLVIFCRLELGWLGAQKILPADELPLPLGAARALWPSLFLSLFGAAVFLNAGGGPRVTLFAKGFALGLIFSILGYLSYSWIGIAAAWRMLGWFCGSFFWTALPILLAGSFVLAALALLHEEARPVRAPALGLLLLLWWLPAQLFLWRLETAWGYGPRDLARAVGVPTASQAQKVNIAWLKRSGAEPYRLETLHPLVEDGVSVDVPDLWKLYDYLRLHRYRSIYAPKALDALRKGWLDWWDPDMALKAASLAYPGRVAPDYLGALALIRAGSLDATRYQNLRALDDLAAPRRAGFEGVTRSQRIFEAFEKAYARFGDQANAGYWISKVDNLWPIYEEKVVADPVQGFQSGRVMGRVFINGRPARSLLVGLFLISVSTAAPKDGAGALSESAFPDAHGRFDFENLGRGFYYLGLMGNPDYLRGRIEGSPGVFSLRSSRPVVRLRAIRVEAGPAPRPRSAKALSPFERHFLAGLEDFQGADDAGAAREWRAAQRLNPRSPKLKLALSYLRKDRALKKKIKKSIKRAQEALNKAMKRPASKSKSR
ncbi:MAG: hypothetical protein KGI84_02905 [Elusimicrobia bacterium]|nr:hypothetical protein [Elusimicrobiota bacterium]